MNILHKLDFSFDKLDDLHDVEFSRDILLNHDKYIELKTDIENLKTTISSSSVTALQMNACSKQKWPLINLVRQILKLYGFVMNPIRKSNGYSKDGKKQFKRFFIIQKK